MRAGAADFFSFAYAVYRQIKEGGLDYRAMGLVYTSLLALIPLLAVVFSVLKAFGADDYLEPVIQEILAPLGDKKESVASFILNSVRGLDVGVLGSVGSLFLLYTSISLLEKIEDSFNHIWRRRVRFSRELIWRLVDYLSFILVGPLLIISTFGGMTELFHSINDLQPVRGAVSPVLAALQPLLPTLIIIASFTVIYKFIPNAPVSTCSALVGGVAGGVSWKAAGWIFATFMANSIQYHAVYSTFAILILFMIWVFLSWMIVLLGVQVSFFHQHPRYLYFRHGQEQLSSRLFERMGLLVMVLIGQRFINGEPPWGVKELSARLELPELCVEDVLQVLSEKGFIILLDRKSDTFVPGRDLSTITVLNVVNAMRNAHEEDFPDKVGGVGDPIVYGLFNQHDATLRDIVGDTTIRDMAMEYAQST
ncbi:MAG: YihY/virulence factor BrkB family protein [Methylococcaceae bacterium]